MRHGSLFSGIGGFDLAAEWMGWGNMFHCEWNQFGQKVLKYYWPNAISYDDICKTDFTIWRGRIDIITGGFPCQPYSMAGKRKGTEDSRHLWPEMLRAIRECQPTWIVGENVPGLINWSGGLVFEQVCLDLEGEGYEVQPVVLPASGVNAPHRRDRVWFVAYNANARNEGMCGQTIDVDGLLASANTKSKRGSRYAKRTESTHSINGSTGEIGVDGYPKSKGLERRNRATKSKRPESGCDEINAHTSGARFKERNTTDLAARSGYSAGSNPTNWTDWPTVAPLRHGNDGLPSRLDGITFPKWRNESIKAGGNAIVPQIAYQIFKTIQKIHI
jgi:DNA (cytosine-5)-methyltransferase 1